MIRKILIASSLVAASAALVACSTTTTSLYPKGNNRYQVVSLSRTASGAAQGSIKKADATCKSMGEKLVVKSNKTKYQGSGKALGQLTEVASDISSSTGGPLFGSTESNSDYKNTLNFSCR